MEWNKLEGKNLNLIDTKHFTFLLDSLKKILIAKTEWFNDFGQWRVILQKKPIEEDFFFSMWIWSWYINSGVWVLAQMKKRWV